jgi:hypothetical protein
VADEGDAVNEQPGLFSAILAVQAEATTLPKDKTAKVRMKAGGEYTYRYTDLATVVEQVGPKLAAHGLVWMTKPSSDEHGNPTLSYKIAHAPSGEFEAGEMPLMLAGAVDSQALGSAITYARRYALCSVLNLVADDDDDGKAAASSAPAGRVSSTAAPTEPQLKLLKRLVTQHKPDENVLRHMLKGVGAHGVDPTQQGWSKALKRDQVSQLIEVLKSGTLPTGQSDIPADASDFERPADAGADEFFEPEAQS